MEKNQKKKKIIKIAEELPKEEEIKKEEITDDTMIEITHDEKKPYMKIVTCNKW